ncbi:MAG TPA: hypothetical protein VF800_29755 [Telluria sp.]|jgi:hypothetical protein
MPAVFLCLLAAKAISELLSLFHTHPLADIGAGILFGLGAAAMLVADVRNTFAYVALAVALYWLVQGATAMSRPQRRNATPISAR